ncbi:hypothetical protein BG011_008937 [Mortierella polycephala]|uniref:non-specific serine/threonine protein kinase n=1 Tax=Mortierella polycephala TaxID=41804 RepID=A0A9P6TWZ8_9FUNG|nr:hypothetical protein BG011_008937 [Mortierella polycephala]
MSGKPGSQEPLYPSTPPRTSVRSTRSHLSSLPLIDREILEPRFATLRSNKGPTSPSPLPRTRPRRGPTLPIHDLAALNSDLAQDDHLQRHTVSPNGVSVREELDEHPDVRRISGTSSDVERQSRLMVSIRFGDNKRPLMDNPGRHGSEARSKHRKLPDSSALIISDAMGAMDSEQMATVSRNRGEFESNGQGISHDHTASSRNFRAKSDAPMMRTELSGQENSVQHTAHNVQMTRHTAADRQLGKEDDLQDVLSGLQDEAVDQRDLLEDRMMTVGPLPGQAGMDSNEQEGDQDEGQLDLASEEDEDEVEKTHVQEYVLEEMEKFEKGFNGLQGRFKLLDKIGEGAFSSVYKAIDLEYELYDNSNWDYEIDEPQCAKDTGDTKNTAETTTQLSRPEGGKVIAIKRIYVTSSPARIENEIAILHDLSGHKNVVPLITAFRFRDQVIVALPYFEHRDFKDYYRHLPMDDIRCYLRALFKGLAHVHAHKIIHRDIKPCNFLYDIQRRTGVLVDFGLAQREEPTAIVDPYRPTRSKYTITAKGTGASRSNIQEAKAKPSYVNKENSVPKKTLIADIQASIPPPTSASTSATITSQRASAAAVPPTPTPSRRASAAAVPLTPVPSQRASAATVPPTPTPSHHRPVVAANAPLYSMPSNHPAQMPNAVNNMRSKEVPIAPHAGAITPTPRRKIPRKDTRPTIRVNRAGTRGFRSPEILFRHVQQTVALDVWATGVMLMSFLTGRFPFFSAYTDADALIEIGILFGARALREAAATFNRTFVCTVPVVKEEGMSLVRVCRSLHPSRFKFPDPRSLPPLKPGSESQQQHPQRQPQQRLTTLPSSNTHTSLAHPQPSKEVHWHGQGQGQEQGQGQDISPVNKQSSRSELERRQFANTNENIHQSNILRSPQTTPELKMRSRNIDMGQSKDPKPSAAADSVVNHTKTVASADRISESKSDRGIKESTGKKADKNAKEMSAAFAAELKDLELAIGLLERLMDLNPKTRITAEEALEHPFLAQRKP